MSKVQKKNRRSAEELKQIRKNLIQGACFLSDSGSYGRVELREMTEDGVRLAVKYAVAAGPNVCKTTLHALAAKVARFAPASEFEEQLRIVKRARVERMARRPLEQSEARGRRIDDRLTGLEARVAELESLLDARTAPSNGGATNLTVVKS